MTDERIPYLKPEARDRSIAYIIEISTPQPKRLITELPSLFHTVGLHGLFFDTWDCAFLALLASVVIWLGCFSAASREGMGVSLVLFVTAPAFWALFHWLSVWKEWLGGTYELLMTMRYTIYQLTMLRMLAFGAAAVVLSTAVSGAVRMLIVRSPSMIRLCSLSFASLFLYAALCLLIEWRFPPRWGCFTAPVIWGALGAALLALGARVTAFFNTVPLAAVSLVALGSLIIFIQLLKQTYFRPREGAVSHAIS